MCVTLSQVIRGEIWLIEMTRHEDYHLAFAWWLMISGSALATTTATIEINGTASEIDDYLCWSPINARVRLITDETDSVNATIRSISSQDAGAVAFSSMPGVSPSLANYSPENEINLTLPADGSWVPFLVSGSAASTNGKDVAIVVNDAGDGAELGRIDVMVRVRKNARSLTLLERERFLDALSQLHGNLSPLGPTDAYEKYARAHALAFDLGIHQGGDGLPLFLAWHRAFLLSLERELQMIDPRVALPYWRFDEDSIDAIGQPDLFTPNFMGRIPGAGTPNANIVSFSDTNPLRGWRMASSPTLMTRDGNPDSRLQDVWPSFLFDTLDNIVTNPAARIYGGAQPEQGANAQLESRHHNFAHVSGGGWLGSGSSPRDPLFFLLHANVDRAWAEWQARFDRFDPTDIDSYPVQGSYPGTADPNRLRKSSYADDEMWPWSRDDGSATPDDFEDNWRGSGFEFPSAPNVFGPQDAPTPASMIDYLNVSGRSKPHGACYDHIDFFGAVN